MKDIINSIKVHLHEKSTSPLFGAFILSWVAWNYKFIFVLLSELKITEKFNYIQTYLYPNFWDNILLGFIFPFISAVIFIFLYPYPAELVYSHWKTRQQKMIELRQKIEGETLLNLNDSREIRRKINELEHKNHEELEEKEKKIVYLEERKNIEVNSLTKQHTEEIESKIKELENISLQLSQCIDNNLNLENEISAYRQKLRKKNNTDIDSAYNMLTDFVLYKEEYLSILSFINLRPSVFKENIIENRLNNDEESLVLYLLDQLTQASLVNCTSTVNKEKYSLTAIGKKFLKFHVKKI